MHWRSLVRKISRPLKSKSEELAVHLDHNKANLTAWFLYCVGDTPFFKLVTMNERTSRCLLNDNQNDKKVWVIYDTVLLMVSEETKELLSEKDNSYGELYIKKAAKKHPFDKSKGKKLK